MSSPALDLSRDITAVAWLATASPQVTEAKAQVWAERYLTAVAYAQAAGLMLSLGQFCAAHQIESEEHVVIEAALIKLGGASWEVS